MLGRDTEDFFNWLPEFLFVWVYFCGHSQPCVSDTGSILWCTCLTEDLWFHLLIIKKSTDWKVVTSCSPLSRWHKCMKFIGDFSYTSQKKGADSQKCVNELLWVGGTKKWAGDNKGLWYFGYFDLKGLLGSTKI